MTDVFYKIIKNINEFIMLFYKVATQGIEPRTSAL